MSAAEVMEWIAEASPRSKARTAGAFWLITILTGGPALILLRLAPSLINPLVCFGLQCLLVGYLVFRSTFLPRVMGVFLALGGFGWLTFLSPALVSHLFPYNLAPGMIGLKQPRRIV